MSIDYAKARENMVEQQVRPWDVLETLVAGQATGLGGERGGGDGHLSAPVAETARSEAR